MQLIGTHLLGSALSTCIRWHLLN